MCKKTKQHPHKQQTTPTSPTSQNRSPRNKKTSNNLLNSKKTIHKSLKLATSNREIKVTWRIEQKHSKKNWFRV
jgi:hypothetical protein